VTTLMVCSRSRRQTWELRPTGPSIPFSFLVLFAVLWPEGQGDGTFAIPVITSGDHSHDGFLSEDGTGHDGAHSEDHHDGHHSHDSSHCGDHHGATCKGKKPEPKVAIAWAMIGLVWFNMCILYLVRRPNAFVRLATYRIVSMAISVYCAAQINQTIFSMLPMISHRAVEITLGLVLLGFEYAMLNLLFRCWDKRGWDLHVLESLGGHILAFAGIIAFGSVLLSCWFQNNVWAKITGSSNIWSKYVAVLFLVTLGLHAGSRLARRLRDYCFEGEHWLHEMEKAENEAKALIIGFLTLQLVLLIITHKPPSLHDHTCRHEHLVPHANKLMLVGVGFVIVMTCVAWLYEKYLVQRGWQNRNVRLGLTMCGAWCIERAAKWFALAFWNDTMVAQVISVFALALGSALCVWVFSVVFLRVTGINAEEGNLHPEKDAKAAWDHRPAVEALWQLFNAFAVVNGLAWDHAYQKSQTVIVKNLADYLSNATTSLNSTQHPENVLQAVLMLVMTCALCGIVVPGWKWYILPETHKEPQFHKDLRDHYLDEEESDESSVVS